MQSQFAPKILNFLDQLSEEELRFLNQEVVKRLRWTNKVKQSQKMQNFRIGERVCFMYETKGQLISGTIIRLNQKTVSIATDDGHRWNVAPTLLKKITQAS